uniref:Uncharacterized protein n=1 Tax=mine drainage metagenome TaxID=410659 RepID=E6QII5_9ZZZZ
MNLDFLEPLSRRSLQGYLADRLGIFLALVAMPHMHLLSRERRTFWFRRTRRLTFAALPQETQMLQSPAPVAPKTKQGERELGTVEAMSSDQQMIVLLYPFTSSLLQIDSKRQQNQD